MLIVVYRIALSQQFNDLITNGSAPFELAAPPRWALTTFRLRPKKDLTFDQFDNLNRKFWSQIEKRGDRLVLTQTVLPEVGFCIRMAIGSPQTKAEHINEAYQVLCECAQEVL
jgi:aromatic-L-amino-acid decarboxylase